MSENEAQNEMNEAPVVIAKEKKLDISKLNLREEVIILNRCAKVVKGGRRFSFSALVVVGDGEGHVGLGFGKANEVPEAITKGIDSAKKNITTIPLMGGTLPHEIMGEYDTARVLMKPASEGTGLIASAQVRKVLELAGVSDILAKSLGSDNVMNVAKATMAGLKALRRPDHIAKLRGKSVDELIGKKRAKIYEDSMERIFGESEDKAAREAKEAAEEAAKNAPVPDLAESEPPAQPESVKPAAPTASAPATEAPKAEEQAPAAEEPKQDA